MTAFSIAFGSYIKLSFQDEEELVCEYILDRIKRGFGIVESQLMDVIQWMIEGIQKVDPKRQFRWEEKNFRPSRKYIRCFMRRNNLVKRSTMGLHKGRAVITKEDLLRWFLEVGGRLFGDPELREAMADPSRMVNQDETALEGGV